MIACKAYCPIFWGSWCLGYVKHMVVSGQCLALKTSNTNLMYIVELLNFQLLNPTYLRTKQQIKECSGEMTQLLGNNICSMWITFHQWINRQWVTNLWLLLFGWKCNDGNNYNDSFWGKFGENNFWVSKPILVLPAPYHWCIDRHEAFVSFRVVTIQANFLGGVCTLAFGRFQTGDYAIFSTAG